RGGLLGLIGGTPMVQLHKLPAPGSARVLCKCEQHNPGGSVKDRAALSMIEVAEAAGRIRPGEHVIVEATTGNTGIGLALVCAAKGYRLRLALPESMSLEKRKLLESYGAELVLTPAEQAMAGAVAAAREMCAEDPRCYHVQQFEN